VINKRSSIILLFGVLFLLAGIGVLCSIYIGSVSITFEKITKILFDKLTGLGYDTQESTILFQIRLPRIILAFFIGAGLSLAGVILQTIFRNQLVEPYTLGISGGAGLAVSASLAFGFLPDVSLPILGFIGSGMAMIFIYIMARKAGMLNMTALLLGGVMFSFISSSVILLIMTLSRSREAQSILFWILGNLESTSPNMVMISAFVMCIAFIVTYLKSWKLNALLLGDEEAVCLGIDAGAEKKDLIFIASLITGVSVSMTGLIGFVGLIVPNFLRLLVGNDSRILVPASFLGGGIFLVFCDTAARTVCRPIELPVGIVTGILGGAMFLVFLMKELNKK